MVMATASDVVVAVADHAAREVTARVDTAAVNSVRTRMVLPQVASTQSSVVGLAVAVALHQLSLRRTILSGVALSREQQVDGRTTMQSQLRLPTHILVNGRC